MTTTLILAVPLLSMLALATVTDCRYRVIPNGLSLGGALLGVAVQGALFGSSGVALAFFGWGICLASFLPFYIRGSMAAGDVKLMAAVGAFLGPWPGFVAVLCTMVTGAIMAVVFLCAQWLSWNLPQRAALPSAAHADAGMRGSDDSAAGLQSRIPFAGAIAAGATIVILRPPLLAPVLTFWN